MSSHCAQNAVLAIHSTGNALYLSTSLPSIKVLRILCHKHPYLEMATTDCINGYQKVCRIIVGGTRVTMAISYRLQDRDASAAGRNRTRYEDN